MKEKLIRITTVPISLKILLKGQLGYFNDPYDLVAVSSGGKELEEVASQEGVRVVPLDMSRQITPVKDMLSLVKMTLLFLKEKPDIVHTHTPKAGLIGMIAAWIVRVPCRLHTVAGMPLMESAGIKKSILTFVEKITYACATNVYPNSYGLESYILEHGMAKSSKLKVLGNGSSNGIDVDHFKPDERLKETAASLKEKFAIEEKDFVYIFVGRLVKDKGLNELLSAFHKLSRENPHLKLLLVGEFEMELDPLLDVSMEILKTNTSIISVGFQQDVRPYFLLSDCLVFPSYREGFPNVVMQAGAMGLPAIVTDINGCNEIIENGKNGLYIIPKDIKSLYDKMHLLSQDSMLLQDLQKHAREMIVSRYDQKKLWAEIQSEYTVVLKKYKKK